MLVLIDESGDAGMKLGAGSPNHLTMLAALFADREVGARCGHRIENLNEELGRNGREFHFTDCDNTTREKFLIAVSPFDFRYFVCCVDKRQLKGRHWKKDGLPIWNTVTTMLAGCLREELIDAQVVIDKTTSEKVNNEVKRTLKRHVGMLDGKPRIKDANHRQSHKYTLLQLADMACGAVVRWMQEGSDEFYRLIRSKEATKRTFPS